MQNVDDDVDKYSISILDFYQLQTFKELWNLEFQKMQKFLKKEKNLFKN